MIVVTAAEMQAMDRMTIEQIGIPGQVLMENAGRGAARSFLEYVYQAGQGRVGVLAGGGNNGGDGFVIARCLAAHGIDLTVFLLTAPDRLKGDAAANFALLPACNVPVVAMPDSHHFIAHQTRLRHCRFWIDAILGTGLNTDVRGFFKEIIQFINSRNQPVFAVDIPSGLNSDTGQPNGTCIHAMATATFGHLKIGHLVQPGADFCGHLDMIDIGIPPSVTAAVDARQHLITGAQVQKWLPRRPPTTHKGDTGHVLVVAGAAGKTGAAAMCTTSALRVGAGLVTLAAAQSLNAVLESHMIEAMTLPLPDDGQGVLSDSHLDAILQASGDKRVIALGPGMGTATQTGALVRGLVQKSRLPMVIDADGLNNLVGHLDLLVQRPAPTVLTPHPGEMARLTGDAVSEIQSDRVSAVRRLARQCRAYVVLKGARTLVADPEGVVWINPTGNPGMASGGMGDVLTGALAGLLAQGMGPAEAAGAAVFLHGLAADMLAARMEHGYLASQVMDTLPGAIRRVNQSPPAPPVGLPLF